MIKLTITENQSNQRLDRFMKKYFELAPLSLIYKMIRKDVKINGVRPTNETMLSEGDELTIYILEDEAAKLQKTKSHVKAKRQFKIAYEDENVLIVEKPFGLLTHGDQTERKNHLANQVIDYLIEEGSYVPRLEKTFTPAPVNRLDRNTTGLVIFGKNAASLRDLAFMMRDKSMISKKYLTIVSGKMEKGLHLIDKMTKDEHNNVVAVIDENSDEGKLMETKVHPLKSAEHNGFWYTLTEVEIITGRTHQIRAHLAKAGFPVIGDAKYGSERVNKIIRSEFNWSTQLLHAYMLEFNEVPSDSKLKYLEGKTIKSSLPNEFRKIEERIFR